MINCFYLDSIVSKLAFKGGLIISRGTINNTVLFGIGLMLNLMVLVVLVCILFQLQLIQSLVFNCMC